MNTPYLHTHTHTVVPNHLPASQHTAHSTYRRAAFWGPLNTHTGGVLGKPGVEMALLPLSSGPTRLRAGPVRGASNNDQVWALGVNEQGGGGG